MRSLNTLSLISASLLHVTRGHMTQEIPSATVPTITIIQVVSSKATRYVYSSQAKAITIRRLTIQIQKAKIAFSSGVDIQITIVSFRLSTYRFVITQYNQIQDQISKYPS